MDQEWHTTWRRALAEQIGAGYRANPKTAAVLLAGSVARGWADRHSDIEIDVYWHEPPSDADRLAALHAAGASIDIFWAKPPNADEYKQIFRRTGGRISQLWPYEEQEWSEHYYAHGVNIGISSFLVETLAEYMHALLDRHEPDDETQMRMAALLNSVPLHGERLVQQWQARAARYPDGLVRAIVEEQILGRDESWWASDFWVERGARLPLTELLCHMERKILRVLLALNRIYLPDPRFKWAHRLVGQFQIAPPRLAERLDAILTAEPAAATAEMQRLLDETIDLVEQHVPGVDVAFAREWHHHRRTVWEEPPAAVQAMIGG